MTTPHSPEAVQALIDAVDLRLKARSKEQMDIALMAISDARENLRPKPTMVPVLDEKMPFPAFDEWLNAIYNAGLHQAPINAKAHWAELRTLTSVPERPETWRMPEWVEITGDRDHINYVFGEGDVSYSLGRKLYEVIRKKIHAMNKETP